MRARAPVPEQRDVQHVVPSAVHPRVAFCEGVASCYGVVLSIAGGGA